MQSLPELSEKNATALATFRTVIEQGESRQRIIALLKRGADADKSLPYSADCCDLVAHLEADETASA